MNARVYVETSIVSYLSARTSRDVVVAAHQQITRRWWRGRGNYGLFISQAVLDEASLGDQTARARRLNALRGIPTLALTDEATLLAGELVRLAPFQGKQRSMLCISPSQPLIKWTTF